MTSPAKPFLLVLMCLAAAPAVAAEPVLLRYKFAKGDQIVYRNTHQEKQQQTIGDMKLDSTTRNEVVVAQVVEEIDGDGNAIIKTKDVSRKTKVEIKTSARQSTAPVTFVKGGAWGCQLRCKVFR